MSDAIEFGDAELVALDKIIDAIGLLPTDAQARIVSYIIARFNIDLEDL